MYFCITKQDKLKTKNFSDLDLPPLFAEKIGILAIFGCFGLNLGISVKIRSSIQMAIEFKNDLNFLQHESYGFILTSSGPQKLIPWDREFGWILWYRLICGGIFMIMNTKNQLFCSLQTEYKVQTFYKYYT